MGAFGLALGLGGVRRARRWAPLPGTPGRARVLEGRPRRWVSGAAPLSVRTATGRPWAAMARDGGGSSWVVCVWVGYAVAGAAVVVVRLRWWRCSAAAGDRSSSLVRWGRVLVVPVHLSGGGGPGGRRGPSPGAVAPERAPRLQGLARGPGGGARVGGSHGSGGCLGALVDESSGAGRWTGTDCRGRCGGPGSRGRRPRGPCAPGSPARGAPSTKLVPRARAGSPTIAGINAKMADGAPCARW